MVPFNISVVVPRKVRFQISVAWFASSSSLREKVMVNVPALSLLGVTTLTLWTRVALLAGLNAASEPKEGPILLPDEM